MPKAWLPIRVQPGFSLVEALLASAVFALLATGVIGAFLYGQEATALAGNWSRAMFLAEEGLEATKNIRDASWTNLNDGIYGLSLSGGQWNLSGNSDVTDGFTRKISIVSVDANRKNVTSAVSWVQNPQRNGLVNVTTRLTYWQKIAAPSGNWANPNSLEAFLNISDTNDGSKIQLQGSYAYMVRADGTPDFSIIDVSTSTSPVQIGSLSLSGVPHNIAVSGKYAYVVTDSNAQELQIINVTTSTSPVVVGSYNAPGNSNVLGVTVVGTTVYLVRASSAQDEFVIVNAAIPASPTLVGSLNLGAAGNEVAVAGSLAFIAGENPTQELQVVNLSVPATPTLVGSLNLPGSAQAIAASGSTVILGQNSTGYLISTSNPSTPVTLGTYAAGGTINDISLGNGDTYAFMATANATNELQVVDISLPALPVFVGGFDATSTLYGVAHDATTNRAYVVGSADTQEFTVIAP